VDSIREVVFESRLRTKLDFRGDDGPKIHMLIASAERNELSLVEVKVSGASNAILDQRYGRDGKEQRQELGFDQLDMVSQRLRMTV